MCENCGITPKAPIHQRRDQILTAAVSMTQTHGYKGVTRDGIAQLAGISQGLVNRYFGTMAALMSEVMKVAVAQRILPVIVQGIAHDDPVALAAPADVKADAMASVSWAN